MDKLRGRVHYSDSFIAIFYRNQNLRGSTNPNVSALNGVGERGTVIVDVVQKAARSPASITFAQSGVPKTTEKSRGVVFHVGVDCIKGPSTESNPELAGPSSR